MTRRTNYISGTKLNSVQDGNEASYPWSVRSRSYRNDLIFRERESAPRTARTKRLCLYMCARSQSEGRRDERVDRAFVIFPRKKGKKKESNSKARRDFYQNLAYFRAGQQSPIIDGRGLGLSFLRFEIIKLFMSSTLGLD